jgi:hypothetical protein
MAWAESVLAGVLLLAMILEVTLKAISAGKTLRRSKNSPTP